MIRFISAAAVLVLMVAGCAVAPQIRSGPSAASLTLWDGWELADIANVSDGGEVISRPDYAPSDWRKATVPGTVLTSLVNDGVYPEPLYGENNRPDKIPESLSRTSYWYRRQVVIPGNYAGKHIWLNFDGINYLAEVWVNGRRAGEIHGAFSRGNFDITDFVHPGEPAAVAVKITPPPHPGTHAEKTVRSGTGRNGGILSEDGATFLCSQGWDWIPTIRDRDIGIWQTVSLSATGAVRLRDPMVTSELHLPRTDSADLTVEATLQNLTDSPQAGQLNGSFEGVCFNLPVSLAANETRIVKLTPAEIPQLHVIQPRLWWPNGYGRPNLYHLHLSFDQSAGSSDACDTKFGIRKITYQLPGSDNLALCVNGVPVMCKGGDWGMDEAMKRGGRPRLEAQIRMHQLANYNMIRNWVGQSSSEDFYDLCDEYGIMVWDEMFQPNPSDGPNPPDVAMYLANVREKILRFRNHPCIALWCGRNEGNPPKTIDAGIRRITSELNPQRLYQPNSRDGRGVRSGGPYSWRAPRFFYVFPESEAFKTEIGSVSIPTLESVQGMMPQKDWQTINDDWAEHDLTRGAQEGAQRAPMYADVLTARYGPIENLADFVRKGQLANYEAFRAMYEGRFAKMFNPSTGVITWMSNSSQPSFVWQIYSHDLEPNAALFAARKACESVHVQMNQSDFHVMVVNNQPQPLENYQVLVRVYNLDGTLKYRHRMETTAAASAATDLGAIAWPADLSPVHFVELELQDSQFRTVADNFYWRAAPEHEDDFTALTALPTVTLDALITRRDKDGKVFLDVDLDNPTSSIALMSHLQLRRRSSGERILPVYYSDNYLSLIPGQTRSLTIECSATDLGSDTPLVAVDGWNVAVKSQAFSGAAIGLNENAQVGSEPAGVFTEIRTTPATR